MRDGKRGCPEATACIDRFLRHEDEKIRFQAARTILCMAGHFKPLPPSQDELDPERAYMGSWIKEWLRNWKPADMNYPINLLQQEPSGRVVLGPRNCPPSPAQAAAARWRAGMAAPDQGQPR